MLDIRVSCYLEEVLWPATKDELIDYSFSGAPNRSGREFAGTWKMKVRLMKVLKISGRIIPARRISCLMKMNINHSRNIKSHSDI